LFSLTNAAYIEWSDDRGRVADDRVVPYYSRACSNASASLRYDF
jgi:hypothetical protein